MEGLQVQRMEEHTLKMSDPQIQKSLAPPGCLFHSSPHQCKIP